MTTGSNTQILIKRSTGSANPGTLKSGELAYSYQSNTLFIGTPGSDSYLEIGGQAVVNKLDSAYNQANSANDLAQSAFDEANTNNTSAQAAFDKANSASTTASAAYGQANAATSSASAAYGQANAATSSASAAYGQANAATSSASAAYDQANSATSSASAAYDQANSATSSASAAYGQANAATSSASAAYGQANAATSSASAAYGQANTATNLAQGAFDTANNQAFTISDGTNTSAVANGTTLTFTGGEGITTTVDGSDVTFDVDNTVVRANTEGGLQHISTDLEISGNLTVQGTTTYVQSTINQTNDSLIELAANNTVGDVLDIGFYGKHEGAGGTVVTGLVRNAGSSDYYLFDNIALDDQTELTSNLITQASLSANGASLYTKRILASDTGTDGGFAFNTLGGTTGLFADLNDTNIYLKVADNTVFNANTELGNYSIGSGAGLTNQGQNAVAIGENSGNSNQNQGAVAVGSGAGYSDQGYRSVAVGFESGKTSQGGWATAVGLKAGYVNQGTSTVAIGHRAGSDYQGTQAVAVGVNSGQNNQGTGAVALGYRAGYGQDSAQGSYSLALGAFAGQLSQAAYSIALNASGDNLDPTNAGFYVNPIRLESEGGGKVTVYNATTKEVVYTDVTVNGDGVTLANGTQISDNGTANVYIKTLQHNTSANVAFYDPVTGELTYGELNSVVNTSSLANNAHTWYVDSNGNLNAPVVTNGGRVIAAEGEGTSGGYTFGQSEGGNDSGMFSPADGQLDFYSNATLTYSANASGLFVKQGNLTLTGGAVLSDNNDNTLFGFGVDVSNTNTNRVAIGKNAGNTSQSEYTVAVGSGAGETNQGWKSVAVGNEAGNENQSDWAVAIGLKAGNYNQGNSTVAIGHRAGSDSQGSDAVAIGVNAGKTSQGAFAVAIGERAGYGDTTSQGTYAIAIGAHAGYDNQAAYSIILNASGSNLNSSESGLFIDPVRYTATQDGTYDGLMFYNSNTKEVRYSYTLDGGSF